MSTGAFSIDQLMELAGLSVSQAGMLCSPFVDPLLLASQRYPVHACIVYPTVARDQTAL